MAVREERPYWQYLHSDAVEHPRPKHESWNGLVLRWDDPWWQYHFPINAWGCQCSVRALSEDDLRRMGKDGPDEAPPIVWQARTIGQNSPDGPRVVEVPEGIDPGFEYMPGQARLDTAVPQPRNGGPTPPAGLPSTPASDPLPAPRPVPTNQLLDQDMLDADAIKRFLRPFGATLDKPAVFQDVVGQRVVVGREMFVSRAGGDLLVAESGMSKKWLMLAAEALRRPAEIWVRLDWVESLKKAVVRRRYLASLQVSGEAAPVQVLSSWTPTAGRRAPRSSSQGSNRWHHIAKVFGCTRRRDVAGVTLEYSSEKVLEALRAAADLMRSPAPMFRDMGEYMLIALDERFESQSAPDGTPWQALSPTYQRRKRKNQDKILVLDGYLKNTIRYQASDDELAVGSNRAYAAIHQFGGEIQIAARSQQAYFRHDAKTNEVSPQFVNRRRANFSQWVSLGPYTIKIPARPWLGTSNRDDDELLAIAQKHLDRALSGESS